jgi:GT2 family glycosyltransferase
MTKARRNRRSYGAWVRAHPLNDERIREMASQIDRLKHHPVISIILPVYNTDERWLRKCIESVKEQIYPHWQLCIADDRSTMAYIRPLLKAYSQGDRRIDVIHRESNGHISTASNSALELAKGEWIVLLDHDDELAADALFWVAKEINEHPEAKLIYTDEDVIDEKGRRRSPKFKPDLGRDLLRSVNYINHLSVYRRDVIGAAGGFRIGFEGSQDYDLLLRVLESLRDEEVRHVPRVLYHWRAAEGSVAKDSGSKTYAHENARRAIREHLERTETTASVEATCFDLHRVRYVPPPSAASSVLIAHPDDDLKSLNTTIFDSPKSYVCFVDDGLEPLSADWLHELIGFADQPHIGIVGGRVIDSRGRIVDGGMIVGTSDLVSVAFKGRARRAPDELFRNCVTGNYSAVSLSCMAMRTGLFREIGGFDLNLSHRSLIAADLCLTAREQGYRIVYDPFVEFRKLNREKSPPPTVDESAYFKNKWKRYVGSDPFYNPNLSYNDGKFVIKI